MKKRLILLGGSLAALLAGALDYGIFRQDTYIGRMVAQLLSIDEKEVIFACGLLKWYLPDYFWMLALSLALFAVTNPQKKELAVWVAVLALYGSGWELAQHIGLVSGTADWLDVIMYIMAVGSAVMIKLLLTRREKV